MQGKGSNQCPHVSRSGGVEGGLFLWEGDEAVLAGDGAESLQRKRGGDAARRAVLQEVVVVQTPTGHALDGDTKSSVITKTVGVGQNEPCGGVL